MLKQPDLHHEGDITLDLCDGMIKRFLDYSQMILDMPTSRDPEEIWCYFTWWNQLDTAIVKLSAVRSKVLRNMEITQDDRKIVDICLCIRRDFDLAYASQFKRS